MAHVRYDEELARQLQDLENEASCERSRSTGRPVLTHVQTRSSIIDNRMDAYFATVYRQITATDPVPSLITRSESLSQSLPRTDPAPLVQRVSPQRRRRDYSSQHYFSPRRRVERSLQNFPIDFEQKYSSGRSPNYSYGDVGSEEEHPSPLFLANYMAFYQNMIAGVLGNSVGDDLLEDEAHYAGRGYGLNADVDSMSYEDLLALQDQMGNVVSDGADLEVVSRLPTEVWNEENKKDTYVNVVCTAFSSVIGAMCVLMILKWESNSVDYRVFMHIIENA